METILDLKSAALEFSADICLDVLISYKKIVRNLRQFKESFTEAFFQLILKNILQKKPNS